ncbi:DUF2254 domain-containing protein [Klebsiella pasteurii]|uniref:DUF2254 domain-containing protein n=1 Tax=Klebsiella pasteurii TaxID=2587529 RepID=UPI00287DE1F9|nr:DUF2254 domain-containing protein [Klebsiella pasteurii]MDS7877044.1 DUF2254 domain-containing protein [Klebsiella pasteurii]
MISRWQWHLTQTSRKIWFRATLFAIAAVLTALLSIVFKSMIPPSFSVRIGAEAVDNILNILASSMLAVTTFSLSIMVTAYGSATTNVTPRATRLVVEDSTTQNVLATFIGSFLFSLVGIIALNMGAYGERGRVILFIVTLIVIALILITLLRWIQHLTSLGRVGETTARVESAAIKAFSDRAQAPYLGGFPWPENEKPPMGTFTLYSEQIGYIEHIDMGRLYLSLEDSAIHVYLNVQPGNFLHPSIPVMFLTERVSDEKHHKLMSAFTISETRSFSQDPRFCLCVLSEIASRALSPAVNDPGTAIDVLGRSVRILSFYAQEMQKSTDILYPNIHVAPLSIDSIFDDIFSPIARDGATLREVQIRLLKSLSMLANAWPDIYSESARKHAREALNYVEHSHPLHSDLRLLHELYADTWLNSSCKDV